MGLYIYRLFVKLSVPNVPCGVERACKGSVLKGFSLPFGFLMYRVELKEG